MKQPFKAGGTAQEVAPDHSQGTADPGGQLPCTIKGAVIKSPGASPNLLWLLPEGLEISRCLCGVLKETKGKRQEAEC